MPSPWPCTGDACGVFAITYSYCATHSASPPTTRTMNCLGASGRRAACETALALHVLGPHACAGALDDDRSQRLHACMQTRTLAWLAEPRLDDARRRDPPRVTVV